MLEFRLNNRHENNLFANETYLFMDFGWQISLQNIDTKVEPYQEMMHLFK